MDWWRPLGAAALTALLLSGCGGGGGSSGGGTSSSQGQVVGPPTTGATLANSTTEASEAGKAMVTGADAMVAQYGALTGFASLLGAPVGMQAATTESRAQILSARTGTATPLAAMAVTCSDFVDDPCSGSVTLDTSLPPNPSAIAKGDFADIRFSRVSGKLLGRSTVLDGRLRIDFLTAINPNSSQLNSLSVLLTLEGFGGSVNGNAFGPITQVSQLDIDSRGVGTMTGSGASFAGMSGVTVSSSGNYVVGSGKVRMAYWGNANQYVDLNLTNWRVVGGRPQVGSTASVAAAAGTATITVSSSSQGSVVYTVSITAGGSSLSYVVTATYPAGTGAPTYTAVRG